LEVYDKFYPNDFEKTIPVHFDMGRVYEQLTNYSMALKHFQISLVSSKKNYPDDHQDIRRTYILIGMIYYKLGQYDLAIEILAELELKEHSISNASIYSSVGECYDKTQQYKKAIEFYGKSLNIIQIVLKNNGPDFLETELGRLNNCIGLCYDKNNQLNSDDDYKKSLEHYNESLKYYERWDNFENCIIIYRNISMLYLKKNNHQLAIECVEKALNIQENLLISKDKQKLYQLYNLMALLYTQFGIYYFDEIQNYDLSVKQFQKALDIRQNILYEITNKLVIADLYRYIGACYCEKNVFATALEYYEKSLELVNHENDEERIAALNNSIADCKKKLENLS
jgi:tetratricopeptide (TPR) repeat protein